MELFALLKIVPGSALHLHMYGGCEAQKSFSLHDFQLSGSVLVASSYILAALCFHSLLLARLKEKRSCIGIFVCSNRTTPTNYTTIIGQKLSGHSLTSLTGLTGSSGPEILNTSYTQCLLLHLQDILNHVFDDMERFMKLLKDKSAAWNDLEKKMKKSKRKKHDG